MADELPPPIAAAMGRPQAPPYCSQPCCMCSKNFSRVKFHYLLQNLLLSLESPSFYSIISRNTVVNITDSAPCLQCAVSSRGYSQLQDNVESYIKFVRAQDQLDKAAYFQQHMAEMSKLKHPVVLNLSIRMVQGVGKIIQLWVQNWAQYSKQIMFASFQLQFNGCHWKPGMT